MLLAFVIVPYRLAKTVTRKHLYTFMLAGIKRAQLKGEVKYMQLVHIFIGNTHLVQITNPLYNS